MGTPKMIKVLNVSTQSSVLSVETSFSPDRAPEIHYVTLAGSEALQFQAVLTIYPFSINQEHAYFIETLSESGGVCFCNVRITSSGSRQRIQIEISAATHASLQQVFNSNIIFEGYVHGPITQAGLAKASPLIQTLASNNHDAHKKTHFRNCSGSGSANRHCLFLNDFFSSGSRSLA